MSLGDLSMRKYFTRRCIGLHLLVLVLVPAFLVAGWWQFDVARGGNDLSWVYTVEWPFFAVYAVYLWWKLIHDQTTPFDRLWAAKQRAAADASGTPIHEIPGWATDKELSLAVRQASIAAERLALAHAPTKALGSPDDRSVPAAPGAAEPPAGGGGGATRRDEDVIDARVVDVKVIVDEELEAYNRYLFDLSRSGASKRWTSSRGRRRTDASSSPPDAPRSPTANAPERGRRAELPAGGAEDDPSSGPR